MFEIAPFVPEIKVAVKSKTCKSCGHELLAIHENFHSAGVYKADIQRVMFQKLSNSHIIAVFRMKRLNLNGTLVKHD